MMDTFELEEEKSRAGAGVITELPAYIWPSDKKGWAYLVCEKCGKKREVPYSNALARARKRPDLPYLCKEHSRQESARRMRERQAKQKEERREIEVQSPLERVLDGFELAGITLGTFGKGQPSQEMRVGFFGQTGNPVPAKQETDGVTNKPESAPDMKKGVNEVFDFGASLLGNQGIRARTNRMAELSDILSALEKHLSVTDWTAPAARRDLGWVIEEHLELWKLLVSVYSEEGDV